MDILLVVGILLIFLASCKPANHTRPFSLSFASQLREACGFGDYTDKVFTDEPALSKEGKQLIRTYQY